MSVFTFDPDPPRVASPWLESPTPDERAAGPERSVSPGRLIRSGLLSDYGRTKLPAEPQDGPTEYKLHLLLRPRRKYERTSTAARISGSTQSRPPLDPNFARPTPSNLGTSPASTQTRQNRLEHLTTQLLWRLQQSCPYHTSSATPELVIPQLPDEGAALDAPIRLAQLLPGLEASRGALYEIGVADDGTLVGLTEDELDESLTTLRVMAASLGCVMEVSRQITVGDCEWVEERNPDDADQTEGVRHHDKLWVAEALVTPSLRPRDSTPASSTSNAQSSLVSADMLSNLRQGPLTSNQLRISLTGATTSGKSTLLGTLSTGTLDNGRGVSRLNMLKHPHELESGITSSVVQELIGYDGDRIINYAHSGVESWVNIHDLTKNGRLVYLVDSAGHLRYRRTILRGIVGWAPHWTLLCIAADSAATTSAVGSTASATDILGPGAANVDLSRDYLDLCLRLNMSLAIVITKMDLKGPSLMTTLNKVFSAIKRVGRVPSIVNPKPEGRTEFEYILAKELEAAQKVTASMADGDLHSVVPIILTSATDGQGIGQLHALLQSLPLPPEPTSRDYIGPALNPEQPACLFHIEDKYSLSASYALATSEADQQTDIGTVVAGYLRFGNLSINDRVVVGPFPPDDGEARVPTPEDIQPTDGSHDLGLSISHQPSSSELNRIAAKSVVSASAIKGEWHSAVIVSIHNLKLPVQTLAAGQVGTIGIVFDNHKHDSSSSSSSSSFTPRLRKGMVVAVPSQHMIASGLSLQAASGLTALFEDDKARSLTSGSLVNIYVASVRASARVIRVSRASAQDAEAKLPTEENDEMFSLSEEVDASEPAAESGTEVQLELLSNREWIELGSHILILEGGSRDRSGLEGFVGKVVEIVD